MILQEPKTRGFPDLVSTSPNPSPWASAKRSPDCYLNVTFACAVEYPDAVGHSLTLKFVFFITFMWPKRGETTPLLSSFQRKVSVLSMVRQTPEHFKWLPYGAQVHTVLLP